MQNLLALLMIGWVFPSVTLARPESNPDSPNQAIQVLSDRQLRDNHPEVIWSNLDDRMLLVDGFQTDEPVPPQNLAAKNQAGEDTNATAALAPNRFWVRVLYPRGQWGSRRSGAQIKFGISATQSATCRYRLRFGPDFEFVKGGKLPGLAGGTATSGKKRPDGSGWTARLMWRQRGEAVLYLYHMDQRKDYADDFPLGVRFVPNRWYQIRQRVQVNEPDLANGAVQIWVDGRQVLNQQNLRLRSGDQAPVDCFYFSTFFGGNGEEWAPKTDQSIDFAQMSVSP